MTKVVQSEAFIEARAKARTATQFKKGRVVDPEIGKKISKGKGLTAPKSRRYYMIAMQNCSFEEWGQIIRQAVQDALNGEDSRTRQQARKWLGDYLMGPPVKRTEITGKDGDAIKVEHDSLTEEQRLMRISAMIDAAAARQNASMVDVTPDDSSS